MGETTLTIGEDTKGLLKDYRAAEHESWSDTLTGMMKVAPSVETVEDGCEHCDDSHFYAGTVEETGGVVQFFHTEYEGEDIYGSRYFCSTECANEAQEEVNAMVPEEPDEVLVGGKSEMRASFEDASFYIDRNTKEVGIPVPGAFAGTDSHGNEYDYEGEPVYVRNEGAIVQKGVIEDIIHEETHTALMVGHSIETVMLNHPNEEKREEYKEDHQKQERNECGQCGTEFQYPAKNPPEECPDCGVEEW